MRTAIIIVIALFFVVPAFAQEAKVQQWKAIISQGKKDTTTLAALDSLQGWYGNSRTDSGMYYAQQLKVLAEEVGNKKYECTALVIFATRAFTRGKTEDALRLLYRHLKIAEETKDTANIVGSYMNIGNSYKEYGDYFKANSIYQKGYDIAVKRDNQFNLANASLNLGYSYEKLNKLDSAFYFEQQGYTIFTRIKRNIYSCETYLGDLYYKLGNIKLAKANYESALEKIFKTRESRFGSRFIVACNLGLANCYKTLSNTDSSFAFARNALVEANKIKYLKGVKDAQKLLAELFDDKHQLDSLAYYQKLYIATSDSLYNRDKSSAIESLTFEQELKAQERQTELQKQAEERSHNIQLAITAIGILSAVILFLLLSRSVLVSHKVVAFLSVLVLLVVFEFINLLIHPWLEKITHHSPILMLLGLVAIAALIIPLHHKLEHWTTQKLVEKNKAIRLANAKKTIEELENNNTK